MADRLASILGSFRAAFRREALPPAPAAGPRAPDAPGLLHQIFAREALPFDAPLPPSPHRGNLAHVFARERLDEGPPLPPHRRSPWLTWLLRPERLDD
jgi:hypothetical protein